VSRPQASPSQPAPLQEGARHRFSYLLAAQLALILCYPFIAGDNPRPGLVAPFAIAVFVAGLFVVFRERRLMAAALVFCLPAIAISLLGIWTRDPRLLHLELALATLFFGFVTAVLLRRVFTSPEVTSETLYGAINGYLLLGLTWGGVYALVEQMWPGSFRITVGVGRQLIWPDYAFFSYVTLTTVGYGDIIPVGSHAKALAVLEAVSGVMYPAILIGRLIAIHVRGTSLK
jgi:ion channel